MRHHLENGRRKSKLIVFSLGLVNTGSYYSLSCCFTVLPYCLFTVIVAVHYGQK